MKRSCLIKGITLIVAALWILGSPAQCRAAGSEDPNQLLAFKKIFIQPIKDNIDGAYQSPVEQTFKEVFDRNPRFELTTDRSAADTVLTTSITKRTSGTDIDITLLIAATGEVFTQEHTAVDPTAGGPETGNAVKQLLKAALKRIPFYGTVTGRDGKQLTFDIGAQHGLKRGDVIQISRIDNIKRHPLLKSIVDVQLIPAGSATVDSVEDTIAFGHVQNEITGETILKLYKVTAIEARAAEPVVEAPPSERALYSTDESGGNDAQAAKRPKLGKIGVGFLVSNFQGSESQGTAAAFAGGGLNLGFRIDGELWLTKRWFADLSVGASTLSYSQNPTGVSAALGVPSSPSYSTSTRNFEVDFGYRYLPYDDLYGPQVYVKAGYYNYSWSTPVDPSNLLTPRTYSGLRLGLGGVLPITSPTWGATLDVGLLLFPSISEGAGFQTGNSASVTAANFFLGGYHYFNPRVALKAGFLIEIFSTSFDNGLSSVSEKSFGFLPSLVFYF